MKIYAVVDLYDDGVWVSEDESETLLFATLEQAEQAKIQIDRLELEGHAAREAKRYERWNRVKEARVILEANNFDGIDEAVNAAREFSPYEWKSKTQIIVLEVQE
jgi:hypothetical protein